MSRPRHSTSISSPASTALAVLLVSGGLAFTSGCRPAEQQSHSVGGEIEGQVEFIDALRGRGYGVEILGDVEQPFLEGEGTRVRLSGVEVDSAQELQLFDYPSADAAASDANSLGPGGAPAGVHVNWLAPPHFFRAGRLLALYVGSDPATLSLLRDLLGDQVAGAED